MSTQPPREGEIVSIRSAIEKESPFALRCVCGGVWWNTQVYIERGEVAAQNVTMQCVDCGRQSP